MSVPSVAVLMSTYNGELFIREQLDSILQQKDVEVKIFVRDDGSTDSTLNILEEYAQKGQLIYTQEQNLRPAAAFMELLYRYAEQDVAEYYAFADQDDIWFNDKLKKAIDAIRNEKSSEYVLWGSNQMLYSDGKPKKLVYETMPDMSIPRLLNNNVIAGCTMVINRELAKLIVESPHINMEILRLRMHDLWLILAAKTVGTVLFDMKPSMYYRIHTLNVVGGKEETSKDKIKKAENYVKGNRSNSRMYYASELLRCFGSKALPESKYVLELYANYKQSIKNKIRFIKETNLIKQTGEKDWVFKLKIMLGYI